MKSLVYKTKSKIRSARQKTSAKIIWKLVWKNSPETFIYNPIIDFRTIPSNTDFRKLTSSKVNKIILEVGTGNGDFHVYLSKKYKKSIIIGFEIAKDYFIKTKNNIMKNLCLNAKISHDEAFGVIKNKFKNYSISKIFINFPDPWPKKKHWKRRFLTVEKFPVILKKMEKGGEIIFVTDHIGYAEFVEKICRQFAKQEELEYWTEAGVPEGYPETKYFQKWREEGRREFQTIRILKK